MLPCFQAVPGVTKIKDKYNPATWMLEASSIAVEQRLGIDFAEVYRKSSLAQYVSCRPLNTFIFSIIVNDIWSSAATMLMTEKM